MQLTYHGKARVALGFHAVTQRMNQLGYHRYWEHWHAIVQGDREPHIAMARERVATLTSDGETWITALCILYELRAIPDPLVITFAEGVAALPLLPLPPVAQSPMPEVVHGR